MKIINATPGRIAMLIIAVFTISALTLYTAPTNKTGGHESIIADWQWAKEYTLAYIESMPESGLDTRPTDSIRSFTEQMLHITSANVGIIAQATGIPPTIENVRELEKSKDFGNKEALAVVVAKGYDYVIAAVEATSSEQMNENIKLFGQFEMTKGDAFHKAFIHQNHHRGQCAVYIRLAGGTPAQMKLF